MVGVTVQISGTAEEIEKINKLTRGLRDMGGAMKTIGDQLVKYYSGQGFGSQGGVFDALWPRLNPIYAQRKAKLYPGRGVLVATGAMQKSFVPEATSNSVIIGNTAPYFKYHQSTEPRTKMPYRPMMKVNGDVKSIVRDVIEADIKEKLRVM